LVHDEAVAEHRVLRDLNQEFGGKLFRLVTRLDRTCPPAMNISTAHCLAFDGDDLVLALHTSREWTIPGGHLEPGESPEEAMHREALEEAGITVEAPMLFAHEEIDPHDGVAADPKYPVPSFQVFYVARLVTMGQITALDECTEARLFSPNQVRSLEGWPQRNLPLYEAALDIARHELASP
jgi:8-oxo-dGTP diphosphatase